MSSQQISKQFTRVLELWPRNFQATVADWQGA